MRVKGSGCRVEGGGRMAAGLGFGVEVGGFRARVWGLRVYRGASLIRKTPLLGPYSRTILRVLWWS